MTAVQFNYLIYYIRHPIEMIRNRKCFIKTMKQLTEIDKLIRKEHDTADC